MSAPSPEHELRRLIARYEENPQGRAFAPLADAYRKAGRFDEALRLCREGLALHPRYPSAYVILGKVHLERGEDAAAREAFEQVLTIDPQNLLALRHLALQAEQAGDQERALRCWEQIAAADPEAEDARQKLAASGVEARAISLEAETGDHSGSAPEPGGAELLTAVSDAGEPAVAMEVAAQQRRGLAGAPDSGAPVPPPAGRPTAEPPPSQPPDERSRAATEIATITLADIYCEQGFKAKALEIYRSVYTRAPHRGPELAEKIARIEAEMRMLQTSEARLQSRAHQVVLAELARTAGAPSPATPSDATSAARRSTGSVPLPSRVSGSDARVASNAPVTPHPSGAVPPATGGVGDRAEPEDFDHFQSWLKKMKLRNQ